MNKQIKQWGEGMIKEWLNEEYAPGKKNLTRILSEPLLEELISYNDTGNFDRVMALMQVMIYREQLYNVVVKKKEKENKQKMLFDGPILRRVGSMMILLEYFLMMIMYIHFNYEEY